MTERPDQLLSQRDRGLEPTHLIGRDGLNLGGSGGSGPGGGGGGSGLPINAQPWPVIPGSNANPDDIRRLFIRWSIGAAVTVQEAGQPGAGFRRLGVELNQASYTDLYCFVEVTGGSADPADFELQGNTGDVGNERVAIRVLAGRRDSYVDFVAGNPAGAPGWEFETVELTLTGEGTLQFPPDGSAPFLIEPNAAYGNNMLTVQITEYISPPPTPTWRWAAGAAVVVPETIGTLVLELVLDSPAIDELHIRVVSSGGSPPAIAGTHFEPVDSVVVIPEGELTGQVLIQIIDDPGGVVGPNLQVRLTGSVVQGTADTLASPGDRITIEIVDDDLLAPTRSVSWASASLIAREPETPAGETDVPLIVTVSVPFTTETDVPVTVTPTNAALGLDYIIGWQPGVPVGFVRFAPGSTIAGISFRALAEGPGEGGSVSLALSSSTGTPPWTLGSIATVVVTIIDWSPTTVEPTRLLVERGIKDGRSLVEGALAVVPPSATLPRYQIDGEDCQVIGLARDSLGRWDSVWVVGMAAGDLEAGAYSYPDVEAGRLTVQLGQGASPAESGVFPAASTSFSGLTFRLRPANSGVTFTRSLADSLTGIHPFDSQVWEGPVGAHFPQVGADLRRTFYHRVWLKDPGDSTADGDNPLPQDRCCLVELWTTYRPDLEAVVCEGRLFNGAHDKDANQLATDPKVDGPVHFQFFDMTGVPAGWAIAWQQQGSWEAWTHPTLTIRPSRAQEYYLPSTASIPFKFVLYNAATVTSQQATRVAQYHSTAFAVGEYGSTRQPFWGEAGDLTLDHARAGMPGEFGGPGGWRRVVASQQALRTNAFYQAWASGLETWPVAASATGWMQSTGDRDPRAPSGDGIDGATALLPCGEWWQTAWLTVAWQMMRTRLDGMDVLTGVQDWQWVRVAQFDPSNLQEAPFLASGADRAGLYRHPKFNTTQVAGGAIVGANAAVWCLAPTTRPWNVHEAGADPQRNDVDHERTTAYQQWHMSHARRALAPARDGWYGCRSPLAYRMIGEYGAWVSRALSVFPAPGRGVTFPGQQENMAMILAGLNTSPQRTNQGWWYTSGGHSTEAWRIPVQVRNWAWAACWASLATAVGDDRVRGWFLPVSGQRHWFRMWAQLTAAATTEFGLFSTISTQSSPDAYSASIWGPPNIPTRSGALPNGNPSGSQHWAYAITFQHHFLEQVSWAVRIRGLLQWPQNYQALSKVMRWSQYMRDASRVFTAAQGARTFPTYPGTSRGTRPIGSAGSNSEWDAPPTLAAFRAGETWWDHGDMSNAHIWKPGQCVYAYRDSGDPTDLLLTLTALGMEGRQFPEDAFNWLYRDVPGTMSIVFNLTSTQGGRDRKVYGEHSFAMTWMATVLNLFS